MFQHSTSRKSKGMNAISGRKRIKNMIQSFHHHLSKIRIHLVMFSSVLLARASFSMSGIRIGVSRIRWVVPVEEKWSE